MAAFPVLHKRPSKFPKSVKLLWGWVCTVIKVYNYCPYKEFQSRYNSIWRWWLLLPKKTWPKWSASSKKTHELQKIRQFESFTRKLGSEPPSSPGCAVVLHPLGAPPADQGTESGQSEVVPSHSLKIWCKNFRLSYNTTYQCDLETTERSSVWRCMLEPTCKIQEIKKHL